MKLGSLFDGSGGFPLAGKLNGIIPVWSSEVEPYPILVTHKNLPEVKHYGDVSKLSGAELEPVDIITFGSPCQDLSQAGKRKGIVEGERSNLFFQAIIIIKEMREKTDGKYPRYAVWENVPGAFSSNKGGDFRKVLEEFAKVKESDVYVPEPPKGKWGKAGQIVGDDYSIAWRTLDAQYWGVPQRRKRIYLVADFDGWSAPEILFKCEGMSRNIRQMSEERENTSIVIGESVEKPNKNNAEGLMFENHGQEYRYKGSLDTANTVTATYGMGGSTKPYVVENEKNMFFNNSSATDYKNCGDKSPTVIARYGTGGNTQPFVVWSDVHATLSAGDGPKEPTNQILTNPCRNFVGTFDVRFTKDGYKNQRNNVYETDSSRTINSHPDNPDSNYGGLAIVEKDIYSIDQGGGKSNVNSVAYSLQGNMIGRKDENGPRGSGINEDVSFTLNTLDNHAVAYSDEENQKNIYSSSRNSHFARAEEGKVSTLVATYYKDPPLINNSSYTVRRLTPKECSRLQGFPDFWTDNLVYENPSEETIKFFEDVFEEHRKTFNPDKKKKTRKQVIKWLTNEHSDSDEYKMWGNGIALPCATFVLGAIRFVNDSK